jgi:hypothetical protein
MQFRFACVGLLASSALAQTEVLLWPDGTPDAPANAPAEVVSNRGSATQPNRSVRGVHVPTLTAYLPSKSKNTGGG